MEALSLAAVSKLQDRDDHFRFQELQKLGRIGEAVGRLKARLSNRVDDFRNPRNQPHYPHVLGGWGRQGGLGGVDPLDADLLDNPNGPNRYGPAIIPNVARNPRERDDGDPFAMFRNYLDGLKDVIDGKGDKELKKLEKLSEIKSLLKDGEWTDEQRKDLEARRDQIFAELQKKEEPKEPVPNKDAPLELVARCVNPQCGAAHDHDWSGPDGSPLDCDVCGGPMFWAAPDAPAAAPAPVPAPVVVDAHAHDDLLDGPREGFVCCDNDVQYPG